MLEPYENGEGNETPFQTWLRLTDEKKQLADVLRQEIPKMTVSGPGEEKRILDIGCSDGGTAVKIMGILDGLGVHFTYYGLDPVEEQLSDFAKNHGRDNVVLIHGGFEKFDSPYMFDLSLGIHSLHYIADIEAAISKLMRISREAIILHHGRGNVSDFHRRFRKYIDIGPHPELTYGDIIEIIKRYDKEGRFDKRLVVYEGTTRFSEWDPQSPEARNLVSFLSGHTYGDLPPDVRYEAHEFLEAQRGTLRETLGAIFLSRI